MKGKMTQLGEGTVDLTTDQSPHRRTAGSHILCCFRFLRRGKGQRCVKAVWCAEGRWVIGQENSVGRVTGGNFTEHTRVGGVLDTMFTQPAKH